MKKLLIIVFLFIGLSAISQNEYAEIEFIPYHYAGKEKNIDKLTIKIYLNDNLVTSMSGNEILNYKIYSKGRINITTVVTFQVSGTIDIKENQKYYFVIGDADKHTHYAEVGEELALKMKSKWVYSNTINLEEDINNPIGNLPDNISKKNRPSQGTGFLINNDGYIITNFHVLEGSNKINVKGIKGDYSTSFEAKLLAVDRQLDLALLKVESKLFSFNPPPYVIGISSEVKQGSEVVALGYPIKDIMGSEIKVTDGIINSISGFLGSISEFQISASVQPGNSGGPLINKNGEIIGVVSAKIKSESVDNVGYAIKSDYLAFFLNQVGGINFNENQNTLKEKELTKQIEMIKSFIYIIETE